MPRSSMVWLRVILRDCEVFAEGGEGGGGVFAEPDVGCSAGEGFDAYGSGAGVEVDEAGAFDAGLEDVEEGLAEAVAGGAGGGSAGGLELARAIGSGDDAHRAKVLGAGCGVQGERP